MNSGCRTAASSEPAPGTTARALSTASALGCGRADPSKTLRSGGRARGEAAPWQEHRHGASPAVTGHGPSGTIASGLVAARPPADVHIITASNLTANSFKGAEGHGPGWRSRVQGQGQGQGQGQVQGQGQGSGSGSGSESGSGSGSGSRTCSHKDRCCADPWRGIMVQQFILSCSILCVGR